MVGEFGLRKVRLTGGEPLLRDDIESLVECLKRVPGLEEVCLTTNGVLLAQHSARLRESGLDRINISLDSLIPERYKAITGFDGLGEVIRGIETAAACGFSRIRLNVVAIRDVNDDEFHSLVGFALEHSLEIRFIEKMPLWNRAAADLPVVCGAEIIDRIGERYPVESLGMREGTAFLYRVRDGERFTSLGLITPVSVPFCHTCDRLRLDARGRLFTCLFATSWVDLGPMLRNGAGPAELRSALRAALEGKKAAVPRAIPSDMSAIGG